VKAIPLNTTLPRGRRPAVAARLRTALVRLPALVREWRRRVRGRAELAALDDRTLRDIGLSRVDIWHEIDKPFWRK
jgi:uncharacterized protein YjiS (DUF1127 family)